MRRVIRVTFGLVILYTKSGPPTVHRRCLKVCGGGWVSGWCVTTFRCSALTRQVGEAVRIAKRGGEGQILNSKAKFDRCKIPRLVVEEQEEKEMEKQMEQELASTKKNIEEQASSWSSEKYKEKRRADMMKWKIGQFSNIGTLSNKREQN